MAGQDRRAEDRHGAEPVDDAAAHVGGDGDRGRAGAEAGAQHDEAGHHVIGVAAVAGVDRAAEDVHEQQHEHDGQHQGREEGLGVAERAAHAARDHHLGVAEG